MTMNEFAQTRCIHIIESEEYLINCQAVQRFKGNGIDENGEVTYGDENGNSVILSDIVHSDKEELIKLYPSINPDIISQLYDAFYADYKFLNQEEIIKAMSVKAQASMITTELLEELAGGWQI